MQRYSRKYSACVIGLLLLVGFYAAQPALAVDCKGLSEEIKREKSLIAKRAKLAEAVKVCPQSAEINYSYGYALERLRDYDQAIKYYKITTGLDSKSASAYFGLGDVYSLQGEAKAAVEAYEKGLRLAPADQRAKKSLESARSQLKAVGGKQKPEEVEAEEPKVVAASPVPANNKQVVAQKSAPAAKQSASVPPPDKKLATTTQPAAQVMAVVAAAPGVEQHLKEGNGTTAPPPEKKLEKQLVLEPRAMKTAVAKEPASPVQQTVAPEAEKAKVEDVKQAVVAKKTEPQKKQGQEAKEVKSVTSEAAKPVARDVSAAVTAVPAAPAVGQSVKTVSIDIPTARRLAPQILQRNSEDQVVAFHKALAKDASSHQRPVGPDFKSGMDLSGFKKIQDSRREEIAASGKIDALPIDPDRPIVPYFKEKHLATPQEPTK